MIDVTRLVALVRRDHNRATNIITTGRLDQLAAYAHDWRRVGLPATSMGGSGTAEPGDPTATDAIRHDPGNEYHTALVAHLEGLARHLEGIIRLDMQAPAGDTGGCSKCGRSLTAAARAGVCGACRRRQQRQTTRR